MRGALLAGCLCVGAWFGVEAGPAVLLKAYPVEVIRGRYLLGRRVAYSGERVKIDSLDGPKAKVFTLDGDVLTVYCADLQLLPEPLPKAARKEESPPSPTPPPVPLLSAAPIPLIPDIFGTPPPASGDKPTTAKTERAGKPARETGERRDVSVQCGGHTKKGTRCTRMTKSPNGLCWQHGGN